MDSNRDSFLPVGIITNVHSRRNRTGRYNADRLGAILAGRGLVRESRHPDEIEKILDEFADRGVKVIGVNGGDGTWGMLLDRLLERLPPDQLPAFLALRGGTMNMVANAVGIRGNPATILSRFLAALSGRRHSPALVPQKTLKVDVNGERSLHGFVWAAGMAYSFLKEYYARAPSSPWNAFWTTVTLIAGAPLPIERFRKAWEMVQAKITVDGSTVADGPVRIAVAAVFEKLVLWFAPFGRGVGTPDDGFGFMLNCMPSFHQVLPRLWHLSRGKYERPGRHSSYLAREVVFTSSSGWLLDGEIFEPGSAEDVTISRGPVVRLVSLPAR